MSDPRFERLRTLFEQAGRLPPAERGPWLRLACDDDPTLAEEVLHLLEEAGRPEPFLSGPEE